jgi:argininosuccinate lyase
MIRTMTALPDNMRRAAGRGFINATDLADYLVKKGLPFREAYKISGGIVGDCIRMGETLETLSLDAYRAYSPLFDEDVYGEIDLDTCVTKRISEGGTSVASVKTQIARVREALAKF